ncbi:hypothetical protein HDU67_004854 [Dinochytrium kinnereticum]|nr:hypothetical protein HDU67_004854 [Dinochytrium kinnereticum]
MSFTMDDLAMAWPVWKEGVLSLRATRLMPFLHAIYIGYAYRKMAPPSELVGPRSFIRGLLSSLMIGMGGGTLAAIISGQPVPWLLYNEYIPMYVLGYLLVCQDPTDLIYTVLDALDPLPGFIFNLVDAAIRGFGLCFAIDQFRSSGSPEASISFVGQLIIGVLTVTGGGTTWKWLKYHDQSFKYPGWDFSMLTACCATYIYATANATTAKLIDEYVATIMIPQSPQHLLLRYFWDDLMPRIKEIGAMFGVPLVLTTEDWKFLMTAFVLVGFLVRPIMNGLFTSAPASAPKVTVPPVAAATASAAQPEKKKGK